MGKVHILTENQKFILEGINQSDYLRNRFYFTGGTVLSEYYLQHRYSDDLDFFCKERFENKVIFALMSDWSKKYKFTFTSRFAEVVYRFDLKCKDESNFKVDFGYYPYSQIEKGKVIKGVLTDSLRDIATNKLITINQRTDVKDFVDLYFLLKNYYTIWDLFYSAEVKFKNMDLDVELIAMDMLKIEDFILLPKMIKPLTLDQLKSFFRELAKKLGKKVVE